MRKEHKSKTGGLTEAGRKYYERKEGGDLKPPVPSGDNPRRVSFAARFAAKEAVSNALGLCWSDGLRWKDIEVVNDSKGVPRIKLHGKAKAFAGVQTEAILISISHCSEYAVACAIITG